MLDERLFFFIHGMATMFFIVTGFAHFRNKKSSRLKKLCGYVLLYWAFLEIKDLALYIFPILRGNYASNLLILVDMTAIPAGCFFVIELLNAGWCTLRRAALLLLPFVLSVVAYAVAPYDCIMHATFIFVVGYSIGFMIYMVYAVRRYNQQLINNFSNIEYLHVRWLKGVAVMLVACLIAWVISYYFSSWMIDGLYQTLLVGMWATALYFAERQQPVQLPAISSTPILPVSGPDLTENLHQALNVDKVWLNPHLTLSDLAKQVGTNRTYLSNYLNTSLQTNFYDYINGFRLQAALEQMHDPASTATMVEIAESSGFNSLSTFRRVFVRAKGCTFVEYRQRIESEKT